MTPSESTNDARVVEVPGDSVASPPATPSGRTWSEAIRRVGSALLVVLVVVACFGLLLSFLASQEAGLPGGYRPLVVRGGSMEPTIWTGSVLIVRDIDPKDISVGDVVTFHTPRSEGENAPKEGTYTTHRVTEAYRLDGAYAFSTKGDANDVADSWVVPGDAIVGRAVTSIPLLGYASLYAKTPVGYVALILVPGLLIIGLEIRSLVSSKRQKQAAGAQEGGVT